MKTTKIVKNFIATEQTEDGWLSSEMSSMTDNILYQFVFLLQQNIVVDEALS